MHTTRYAHCEGYTDICFADNGKFLTTGEDGDVRIWAGFDDLDNTSIRVGDKCFAIAYKSGKIYVSDELNELKRYDLETQEFQGVITSFTLPITSISVNKSNSHLVCGSSDFEIHLVDLSTLKFTSFSGHDAPILYVLFDPLEKYFVSTSCDGTAKFWSVQNLNNTKTLTNLHAKSNDFIDSNSWSKLAWHKDGGLIAVPCEKDINFYERETWILKFKINLKNDSNPTEEFLASIICFSPDGKYVLACTNTQMIYVHSIINKQLMFKYSYSKKSKICSLVWNPFNQNEIIFCDIKGNMGQIKPSIKDDLASTNEIKSNKSNKIDDNLEMEDLLNLIDEDSKSNDSVVEKKASTNTKKSKDVIKSPNKKRKRLNEDEDENEEQNREEEKENNKPKMNKNKSKIQDEDDDEDLALNLEEEEDENEEDFESLEKLKSKTFNNVKKEILSIENDENEEKLDQEHDLELSEKKKEELFKEFSNFQVSFQPSSTPLVLPERYMCWNSVGLITQFSKEGDESIDIEFHNASYHHTIHIKNQFGYTMADMSKEAVVLASPGSKIEEETELNPILSSTLSNHSKLTCILLNSLDNTKEWNLDMLKKEYIKCISVSRFLIACCTSRKFIRIYCLAGTQKEIISAPGMPICVSAYDNCVFVAYNMSNCSIGYSIYYIDDLNRRDAEHGILPISDNAKLEWLGFSDEGNPYCYDSNGFLYTKCLTVSKLRVWTPITYMRTTLNHKTDNYWLVGISERNQIIKSILCRGSKYPNVLPRPTLSTVHFAIPLSDPDTEKTQLEKDYWKNKYLSYNIKNYDISSGNVDLDQDEFEERLDKFESTARESLMKLFMLACKNNKEQRAYEIATIMDLDALQLAIKYSTKTRALVLAQNLNILAEKKAEIEYNKDKCQQEELEQTSRNYSSYQNHNNDNYPNTIRSTMEDTGDIIVEKVTQTQKNTQTTQNKSINETQMITDSDDTVPKTPTLPLGATRLNPFAKSGLSARMNQTPTNDSPRSIMNEIEEKLTKQSAKEKDTWKPTPTRKLVKSKVSSGTPNSKIGSFFNK